VTARLGAVAIHAPSFGKYEREMSGGKLSSSLVCIFIYLTINGIPKQSRNDPEVASRIGVTTVTLQGDWSTTWS
jgi:hypothetical protein